MFVEKRIKKLVKKLLNREQLFFESGLVIKKENQYIDSILKKRYISFSNNYTLKMSFFKDDLFFCCFEFSINKIPMPFVIFLSIDNDDIIIKCKKVLNKSNELEEIYLTDKFISKLFKLILKNKKNIFNEIKKIEESYFLARVVNSKLWDLSLINTN